MYAIRRKTVQSAGQLGARAVSRRHASTEHHDAHSSGSSSDHGHHNPGDGNESLGMQFYIAIGVIPACYAVYALSRDSKDSTPSAFKKLLTKYSDYQERWLQRNTLHTQIMEQAAFDSNVFLTAQPSKSLELRFPEIFNTGSPYNVEAGQSANLGALIAHYEKINAEGEEKKLRALAEKSSK